MGLRFAHPSTGLYRSIRVFPWFEEEFVFGLGTITQEETFRMKSLIDDNQLLQLIRNGDTVTEAARKLGVGKAAVSKRLKALNVAINRNVTIRAAHKIVDREINALDQLQKINRDANELLDLLMRWNRGEDDGSSGTRISGPQNQGPGAGRGNHRVQIQGPARTRFKGHAGNPGATEAAARNLPGAFRYAGGPAISG